MPDCGLKIKNFSHSSPKKKISDLLASACCRKICYIPISDLPRSFSWGVGVLQCLLQLHNETVCVRGRKGVMSDIFITFSTLPACCRTFLERTLLQVERILVMVLLF